MTTISVTIDGYAFEVEVRRVELTSTELTVLVDGEELAVAVSSLKGPEEIEWIMVGNRPYEVIIDPDLGWIKAYDGLHHLEIHDTRERVSAPASADGRVKAPIPGLVTRVLVELGEEVRAGRPLLYLEAMKMENEVLAPRTGRVVELKVVPGQVVAMDEMLAEIA